jgi:branched-chain amino acid transport system substrate-binding protein
MARLRRGWFSTVAPVLASVSLLATGCSNSSPGASKGRQVAPDVTDTSITVGSIADVTGPLSADFAPIADGVQAYFDMVNAQGGVYGRKLKLGFQTDDQGSSTVDLTQAQKLVEQDNVFAIVGVGTPFFGGAHYLASLGIPTFGYQVSSDWHDGPSLFGAYGSLLDYSAGEAGFAYFARHVGAQSVGVIAYGVPQSAAACRAIVDAMQRFNVPVGYQDLNFQFGSDPTADVLQMQSHHVDTLFTCIDVTGNVAFARAIQQNGLSLHQLWLNGYDRTTLDQYGSLMTGVYLSLQHVPFEAAAAFPGQYPGIEEYLRTMQRYKPSATYNEVALDGWVSAALFVSGLRAAGRHVTQAKVVAAINQERAFTGDNVTTPVDWTTAHDQAVPPFCSASVMVQNGKFVPVVSPYGGLFVCFDRNSDIQVPPKTGTPGT